MFLRTGRNRGHIQDTLKYIYIYIYTYVCVHELYDRMM